MNARAVASIAASIIAVGSLAAAWWSIGLTNAAEAPPPAPAADPAKPAEAKPDAPKPKSTDAGKTDASKADPKAKSDAAAKTDEQVKSPSNLDDLAKAAQAAADAGDTGKAGEAGDDEEKLPPAPTSADKKGSPQRFTPSEQVRADFDVSFPIDI